MANLIKISEVFLYMGFTKSAADTYQAMELLNDAGIKYSQLAYNDPTQHQAIFDALNTWTFGSGENTYQKVFTDFPILHWTEYYDDWIKVIQVANGLDEIKTCSLLTNKTLVS